MKELLYASMLDACGYRDCPDQPGKGEMNDGVGK